MAEGEREWTPCIGRVEEVPLGGPSLEANLDSRAGLGSTAEACFDLEILEARLRRDPLKPRWKGRGTFCERVDRQGGAPPEKLRCRAPGARTTPFNKKGDRSGRQPKTAPAL
jgi:hypothetical protein